MRFTCRTEKKKKKKKKKKKNLLHVFFLVMHVYTYISECPPPRIQTVNHISCDHAIFHNGKSLTGTFIH